MGNIDHTKHPVSCEPQIAFNAFLAIGDERTIAEAARLLRESGEKIGYNTVYAWSKKYDWHRRINLSAVNDISADQAAAVLGKLGKDIDHGVIDGMQGQLIKHVLANLSSVIVKTPDDVGKMIRNVKELQTISHNMRGTEVTFDTSNKSKTNGNGSNGHDNLIDLGEFKKPKYD